MKLHAAILSFCLMLAGCASTPDVQAVPPPWQEYTEIVWAWNAGDSPDHWRPQIEERFPTAVVLFAHGTTLHGQWVLEDQFFNLRPAYAVVDELQARYPGQIVVLISCNEDGHRLWDDGVVYATEIVWLWPDDAFDLWTNIMRDWEFGEEIVGSIDEFVVND